MSAGILSQPAGSLLRHLAALDPDDPEAGRISDELDRRLTDEQRARLTAFVRSPRVDGLHPATVYGLVLGDRP